MFNFFKKKKSAEIKKEGQDSYLSLESTTNDDNEEEVYTTLVIPPAIHLPKEQEYVYRFLHNELHPLKPNQLSISGIQLDQQDKYYYVTAFIRNSLPKELLLDDVELFLLNDENQFISKTSVNFSEMGPIPPMTSLLCGFQFPINNDISLETLQENWSVAFNMNSFKQHSLELEPSWENSLSADQKNQLQQFLQQLPTLKPNEFNIAGVRAQILDEGSLLATLLFRNGTKNNIQIEQLPLKIVDATGEIVAQGHFKLQDFIVKANTSKPWSFIFPKELVLKEELDLSKWKPIVPQS
ncbi:accessory Sec system S-layer assembly protein [Aeribacillus pallidus]|uniref:accessory Sec system S-layer assembly protein n=1 Tax=Aeribacillus pallidus TaxID=33936 RepID=UPI003D2379CF